MIRYTRNGVEVTVIDFGITPIGTRNTVTLQAKNDYADIVELSNEYSLDPDVTILSYPKNLNANETGNVIIEFFPKLLRDHSLKLSKLGFQVVIG
jgi:hypothetical protein